MAEERDLATVRAPETTSDDEATKAELQRRMEEARESITQTVTEIKDTVTTQYQHVRESINEALDWREQFRRRPVAFSVGALSVGLLFGYGLAGTIGGTRRGYEDDYDTSDIGLTGSYTAQGLAGTSGLGRNASESTSDRSSLSSSYDATALGSEPQKPGLIERFKGTHAYDRLQSELASLGDRFIDELSTTAQAVVLPALLGKVKELIGVDLSGQQQRSNTTGGGSAAHSGGAASSGAQTSYGETGGRAGNEGQQGGTSYGSSENASYGRGAS